MPRGPAEGTPWQCSKCNLRLEVWRVKISAEQREREYRCPGCQSALFTEEKPLGPPSCATGSAIHPPAATFS
jgi:DNA-directed RNA polymerase subunit RPC12/RpoP